MRPDYLVDRSSFPFFVLEFVAEGAGSVKEVAARLEFADAFHFSRAFKRLYGLPPQRFIRHGAER